MLQSNETNNIHQHLFDVIRQMIGEIYSSAGILTPVIKSLEVRKNLIYCDLTTETLEGNYAYWVLNTRDGRQRACVTAAYQNAAEKAFFPLKEKAGIAVRHVAALPHQLLSDNHARKQLGIIFENGNYVENDREAELKLKFTKLIKNILKRGVRYLRVYELPESKSFFYFFEGYLNASEQEFASSTSFDFSSWHEYYLHCFKKAAKELHGISESDLFSVNVRLEYEKNIGFLTVDLKDVVI